MTESEEKAIDEIKRLRDAIAAIVTLASQAKPQSVSVSILKVAKAALTR